MQAGPSVQGQGQGQELQAPPQFQMAAAATMSNMGKLSSPFKGLTSMSQAFGVQQPQQQAAPGGITAPSTDLSFSSAIATIFGGG